MHRTFLAFLLLAKAATSAPPSNQIAITSHKAPNGSFIPGDSPARYCSNPANDSFQISSIDMYPNACVIESYCGVKFQGTFTTTLTTPHISFKIFTHFNDGRNISFKIFTHFNDGRIGEMPGEDDFCNWMSVVQNGTLQCPPKAGKATLSKTVLLFGGWTPEANYTVDVRVTSDQGPVFHICAAWEMKYRSTWGVELR